MAKEIRFECKVKRLEEKTTRTLDIEKKEGLIVLETDMAERITIKGEVGILDGFTNKDNVLIRIQRNQETISESLGRGKKA